MKIEKEKVCIPKVEIKVSLSNEDIKDITKTNFYYDIYDGDLCNAIEYNTRSDFIVAIKNSNFHLSKLIVDFLDKLTEVSYESK